MSSESESSDEDEEEQRRINEAVSGIDSSVYQNNKTKDQNEPDSALQNSLQKGFTLKGKHNSHIDVTKLKSNRLQDRNDVDPEPLLQTTPEFRAYVAKQLVKLLDRDLSERLEEKAWEKKVKLTKELNGGIRLFSNSPVIGGHSTADNNRKELSKVKFEPKKRKIRLSSSSDSSADEDIKACLFSVSDIERENLQLARLQGSSAIEATTTTTATTKISETDKLSAVPHVSELNTTSVKVVDQSDSKETVNGEIKGKKKKKLKGQKNIESDALV